MKTLQDYIKEGLFSSISGVGTSAESIAKALNRAAIVLKEDDPAKAGDLEPKFVYDKDKRGILYKGKDALSINTKIRLCGIELDPTLSDSEVKKFWDAFNKTTAGKLLHADKMKLFR
jgi:hypothetical protein